MLLLVLVAGGEADGFALLCGLLLGADELVVFLDAVYFFCLLFACGHGGFFLLGGVGAPYRYALWRATTHNENFYSPYASGEWLKYPFWDIIGGHRRDI